ncbi:MAG: hypothetical protein K5647_04760 [Clostridiales bacterium]|nr:hypothetical protein [Clostridiales bacterium]
MHDGDLVFEIEVFDRVVASPVSCMTVSSTLPLPDKDFKARVADGMVTAVGVDIFNEAMEALASCPMKPSAHPEGSLPSPLLSAS